jgi:nucleoside 2-deoxyribosyltransferase
VKRIKRVYLAGPLTTGNMAVNVHVAVMTAERLRRAGFVPFPPHLFVEWEKIAPGATYEEWLELCFAWLEVCDAVLRMPGHSPGADREVEFARKLGIPVFTSAMDLYTAAGLNPIQANCQHLATTGYAPKRCMNCNQLVR